jgi:hypothetical protein
MSHYILIASLSTSTAMPTLKALSTAMFSSIEAIAPVSARRNRAQHRVGPIPVQTICAVVLKCWPIPALSLPAAHQRPNPEYQYPTRRPAQEASQPAQATSWEQHSALPPAQSAQAINRLTKLQQQAQNTECGANFQRTLCGIVAHNV